MRWPRDPIPTRVTPGGRREAQVTQLSQAKAYVLGDDFAARTTWEEILGLAGWTKVFTRGDTVHWRRPGKDRGVSATTGHTKGLKVFTTSTSFATTGTYTKLGAYAALNHGGDFKAAVKILAEKGFGTWIDDDGKEHQNPVPREWFEKRTKSAEGRAFRSGRGQRSCRRSAPTCAASPGEVSARGAFDAAVLSGRVVAWASGAYRPVADVELLAGAAATVKNEFDRLNRIAVKMWENERGED